jgi:hypothetical protein
MPIINNPKIKISHVLKSDQLRPKEEQTTFYFRTLMVEQWLEFAETYQKIMNGTEGPDMVLGAISALKKVLTGWSNFKIDGNEITFAPESVNKYLSMQEILELMMASLDKQTLTIEDKKKLESQLPSD